MFFSWFIGSHHLRFASSDRTPPDPTLFPFYIQNRQGLWLRFKEWWPRAGFGDLKGVVFIVSGYGEHGGRYDSVALRFNEAGYVVFSVDNQGAGGSEGVRLYVERFSHFVDDIQFFAQAIYRRYPELTRLPRFLLGHSLGGLIATHVAQRDPNYFSGVVLSGPSFQPPKPLSRWKLWWLAFLSRWVPKYPIGTLNAGLVSTNTPVVELVMQDPFYTRGRIWARYAAERTKAQAEALDGGACSTFSFLIVHGEEDKLCSVEGSRAFLEKAHSVDKQLITYPGAYHEVLTEVCRSEVMEAVLSFVKKRTL